MAVARVFKEPTISEMEEIFNMDHLHQWARISGATNYPASMVGSLLAALGVPATGTLEVDDFATFAADDLESTMSPGRFQLGVVPQMMKTTRRPA